MTQLTLVASIGPHTGFTLVTHVATSNSWISQVCALSCCHLLELLRMHTELLPDGLSYGRKCVQRDELMLLVDKRIGSVQSCLDNLKRGTHHCLFDHHWARLQDNICKQTDHRHCARYITYYFSCSEQLPAIINPMMKIDHCCPKHVHPALCRFKVFLQHPPYLC